MDFKFYSSDNMLSVFNEELIEIANEWLKKGIRFYIGEKIQQIKVNNQGIEYSLLHEIKEVCFIKLIVLQEKKYLPNKKKKMMFMLIQKRIV